MFALGDVLVCLKIVKTFLRNRPTPAKSKGPLFSFPRFYLEPSSFFDVTPFLSGSTPLSRGPFFPRETGNTVSRTLCLLPLDWSYFFLYEVDPRAFPKEALITGYLPLKVTPSYFRSDFLGICRPFDLLDDFPFSL